MKYYCIFLGLILTACTGAQEIVSSTGIEEIKFGNGGGFTGAVHAYTLTSESKILREGEVLKEISTEQTKALFKKAKALKEIDYQHPGNLYSFIELKTDKGIHRIVWAYGKTEVNKNVIELYRALQSLIQIEK